MIKRIMKKLMVATLTCAMMVSVFVGSGMEVKAEDPMEHIVTTINQTEYTQNCVKITGTPYNTGFDNNTLYCLNCIDGQPITISVSSGYEIIKIETMVTNCNLNYSPNFSVSEGTISLNDKDITISNVNKNSVILRNTSTELTGFKSFKVYYKAVSQENSGTTPKTYTSLDALPIGTVLYKDDMIKIADDLSNNMRYYVTYNSVVYESLSDYTIPSPGEGYVGWIISDVEYSYRYSGDVGNLTRWSTKSIKLEKYSPDSQQNVSGKTGKTENATAHTHSYSWVIESEATEGSDGVEVYKCSCGDVQARSVIPASQVYVNKLRDAIVNAPINGTVTYDSKLYHTFSDYIIKRLAERTDVTTVIDFKWQNADYTMTIPAGVDYAPFFADTENFYGYFCFAQMTGSSIVAK